MGNINVFDGGRIFFFFPLETDQWENTGPVGNDGETKGTEKISQA